jgi:hypothetical protein
MSPTQKAVLISLADQANDQGVCWPSIETICRRTCISRRSVIDAVKALEDLGHLSPQKTTGRVTHYVLHPCASRTSAADAPVQMPPPTRANAAPDPCSSRTGPVQMPHPNRKEPSENRKGTKSKGADAPIVMVPDWIPGEAWADFVAHRKSIRKPLTSKAAELAIRALAELRAKGQRPTAVIEQSIAAGWTGLFPLKTNSGAAHETTGRLSAADRVRANCRRSEERELAEHGFIRP